nr:RluA family pseudouridine synthase [uncultured Mediterraneibacter sp.]
MPDIRTLILYKDEQIIVCHKPAGIAVQSARVGTPDMESLLKNYLSSSGRNKKESPRPPYLAVIHRLDQPVEGLLVFAKTPAAAKGLNRQLTSSGFGKYYHALVIGKPHPTEGILENYLVKDGRSNMSRICTKDTPGAKPARLYYKTEAVYEDHLTVTSLVKIRLDTGRHHQIRVQMAHLGCPLAGDRKYGKAADEASGTDRKSTEPLKLCAYRLEFRHPGSGKEMVFELPAFSIQRQ